MILMVQFTIYARKPENSAEVTPKSVSATYFKGCFDETWSSMIKKGETFSVHSSTYNV